MAKKQHYMTWDERQKLEAYYNGARLSVLEIAKLMNFSRQTIYNELKIGSYVHTYDYYDRVQYSAYKAQQLHDWAQSAKGRPEKIGNNFVLVEYLENKILNEHFSPAAALAAARKEATEKGFVVNISVQTLYNYIENGLFLNLSNADLWEKPKRKKRKKGKSRKRIAHPNLPSISDRPQAATDRSEFGHWEMDLVVSCQGSSAVLLTLTERSTRLEKIIPLPLSVVIVLKKS